MNATTLEPAFLVACLQISAFKGGAMRAAQGALLTMALRGGSFTAADLPEAVTGGSRHLAGAATGSLISMGLLVVVDRVKSPDEKAKGRKVDVLRLADGKRATVLCWLVRNGLPYCERLPTQTEMALA